jgi:hypothetical protein
MKPVRFQTYLSPAIAAAIRANAKQERVSAAAYVRNALIRHVEGLTVLDPVRVALGETASMVVNHAHASLEATGAQIVQEVRAEREETRQDIRDFIAGLSAIFDLPTP